MAYINYEYLKFESYLCKLTKKELAKIIYYLSKGKIGYIKDIVSYLRRIKEI